MLKISAPALRTFAATQHYAPPERQGVAMIELLTVAVSIFSFGFMAGYAVRAAISHRRHTHHRFH
jgi:hypothetical protein